MVNDGLRLNFEVKREVSCHDDGNNAVQHNIGVLQFSLQKQQPAIGIARMRFQKKRVKASERQRSRPPGRLQAAG